jgi:hypothetical protein
MTSSFIEIAKLARAALRKTFPGSKFSVTSDSFNGITIRWTDDGPTVELVEETLLLAGYAKTRKDWRGGRHLETPDNSSGHYWFDRHNAAERAAELQGRERFTQEREAENQRIAQVIACESATRQSLWPAVQERTLPAVQDPSAFVAFETLRQRAETEAQISEATDRRPSWAPPLLLGEELAELCLELEYITLDDKWIGRLWADFAAPRRSSRWLRQHVSKLPLDGVQCRGFSLWAGSSRGVRSDLLFEAQREQSGGWRFGPRDLVYGFRSAHGREWEQLVRGREGDRHELEHHDLPEERRHQLETRIAEYSRRLEEINAEDLAAATAYGSRQHMRQRTLELARARVLEFIGAPDVQMTTAARLWEHCRVCGKTLTDPISLERGIGPDCHAARIDYIRRAASEGRSPENIAAVAGMPVEFVSALLSETREHRP